ncbi:MAG TPA: helix-turn-helix domain-containing protein [Ktedonobacterales bacterium]|nr:helix-turn-helix domain-containing protein [Ktedonobacterales bacterium]
MPTTMNPQPVAADTSEHRSLDQLNTMLEDRGHPRTLKIIGPGGEEVVLSDSVVTALRQLVRCLAHDKAVTVVPVDKALTTQEAADILNVSRPYLIKLLEAGALPFTKVGSHRRIQIEDIMAYKQRRDVERAQALDRLAALNQEMGLYDN